VNKLSKSEFMSKVVNDLYEKKRQEKERLMAADIHAIQNVNKINKYMRRKKRWK
jgi:predicted CopG family antitoxin